MLRCLDSENLKIFKSENLQISKSSNLQIFKSPNLQIFNFMKRILLLLALCLMVPSFTATAQSSKKNKKEVSPFIEGKQKVRQLDYDSVWKFSSFDAKHIYFCEFDYRKIDSLSYERHPDWEGFQPVVNYLTTVSRTPARICAIYAINPNIKDGRIRDVLVERANNRALECLDTFQLWCEEEEMKNKMQFQVAQVDYRYWKGESFLTDEIPEDDIIPLGMILYFGTKKVDFLPSAAQNARTFKEIRFFPNDATIVDSYYSMIDEIVKYLNENDRLEILLTGYSDNLGTDAYNMGLSRQRANEVRKLLLRKGIAEHRIEVQAKGAEDPVGDNNTYEGRIANNRVVIALQ